MMKVMRSQRHLSGCAHWNLVLGEVVRHFDQRKRPALAFDLLRINQQFAGLDLALRDGVDHRRDFALEYPAHRGSTRCRRLLLRGLQARAVVEGLVGVLERAQRRDRGRIERRHVLGPQSVVAERAAHVIDHRGDLVVLE